MKIAQLDLTNSRYFDLPFQSEISLNSDCSKSFDSFHNSFFETYWSKYTTLKNVSLSIELSGVGSLELIRVCNNQEKIIQSQDFNTNSKKVFTFHFSITPLDNSRVYIKVNATKETNINNNAYWYTDDTPAKTVKLALIMCTFNKQDYILKNLENLFADEDFKNSSSEIFVVDNASNLNLDESDQLHYVPQENYGGAGGFTRGLIEARSTQRFTHYLFMDDDIELDPDTILRSIAFTSFTNNDYSFSGAMLCMDQKNTIWESGANYLEGRKTFIPKALFHERDLDNELLNEIATPYDLEYGGWWFFCFSNKAVDKIGLPMPFFIRGDDVEFALRLKKAGFKNICLPGIGVWHETFVTKSAYWLEYYNFRNYFILTLIHTNFITFLKTYLKISINVISSLIFFDYNLTKCRLSSLSHLIKASSNLGKFSNPEHQSWVVSNFKKLNHNKSQKTSEISPLEKGSVFDFFAKIITLNAHLLPANNVELNIDSYQWKINSLRSKFYYSKITVLGEKDYKFTLKKDNKEFWKLLIQSLFILSKTLVMLYPLKKRFIKVQRETTQLNYWKKFLKIS